MTSIVDGLTTQDRVISMGLLYFEETLKHEMVQNPAWTFEDLSARADQKRERMLKSTPLLRETDFMAVTDDIVNDIGANLLRSNSNEM